MSEVDASFRRIRGRLWKRERSTTARTPTDEVLEKLAELRDAEPFVQAMALHNGKLLAGRAYKAKSPAAIRVELIDAAAHLIMAAEIIDADGDRP